MIEIWKDIEGYENKYQVSNLGNVKSLERLTLFGNKQLHRKEQLLSPRKGKQGYLYVNLYSNNGTRKTHKIHRLVADAFIENINNYKSINHKDEHKENNCVENLEWCTQKYNNNYGTAKERSAEKRKHPVGMYSICGELIKVYDSIKSAEEDNNYSIGSISKCCNNKSKTAFGYAWKFLKGGAEICQ